MFQIYCGSAGSLRIVAWNEVQYTNSSKTTTSKDSITSLQIWVGLTQVKVELSTIYILAWISQTCKTSFKRGTARGRSNQLTGYYKAKCRIYAGFLLWGLGGWNWNGADLLCPFRQCVLIYLDRPGRNQWLGEVPLHITRWWYCITSAVCQLPLNRRW